MMLAYAIVLAFFLPLFYCVNMNAKFNDRVKPNKIVISSTLDSKIPGYKCGSKLYNEFEIKTAMKRGCNVWQATRHKRNCKSGICETKMTAVRDQKFKDLPRTGYQGPIILHPILRNPKIYSNGNLKDAGHDRIVITKDCKLLDLVTSFRFSPSTWKVKKCESIKKSTVAQKPPSQENVLDLEESQDEILSEKLKYLQLKKLKGKEILIE